MNKLMEAINISRVFKKSGKSFYAISNVNFEICAGEFLGMVGPSGSGKTTIGRILVGLLPATRGKILFEGNEIRFPFPKSVRPMLQLVFQEPASSLSPRLNIIDLVQEPLILNRFPKEQAKDIARKMIYEVGLGSEHLNRYYWELSGGESQRVAIARAMALRPKFVVLDEISSGLDPITAIEITKLVKILSVRYGISIIFITHDLGLAWSYCERILFISHGKISGGISEREKWLSPEARKMVEVTIKRQSIPNL